MRLLLNLLDISKSEEGRLVPVRAHIEVAALVRSVFDALAERARAKSIELKSSVDPFAHVRADADLLRRVVENLLENALRHAPEESAVQVSSELLPDAFVIRIADRGAGVAPELRESIFERFVQLESKDRSVTRSGRGLGLTFCRLAVEAHGGRIWVEDGSPGAVFCLSLPHVAD
jgi:signal transduction histidine kinase